jgi:DNA polymerase-3 subunit epsilon
MTTACEPALTGVGALSDRPLASVTFVVVDLETTGGDPDADRVTEIGAVKVCGGDVLGEFATLVNPGIAVPESIAALTGLSDAVLCGAPTIAGVLASFAEFSRGSVLVAHNAPFDLGFLRAESLRCGAEPPTAPVLDTVALARAVLSRDEAPNCRLATLAELFRAATTPVHRALADARATVDVLHALLERLGSQDVATLGRLGAYRAPVGLRRRPLPPSP